MDCLTNMPHLQRLANIETMVTVAVRTTSLVKNSLFKKYIKLKDPVKMKYMINTSTTEAYIQL